MSSPPREDLPNPASPSSGRRRPGRGQMGANHAQRPSLTDVQDWAQSSFARSLFAGAQQRGPEPDGSAPGSGSGGSGAGGSASGGGGRDASQSAPIRGAGLGTGGGGSNRSGLSGDEAILHASAPGGLAMQVLDSIGLEDQSTQDTLGNMMRWEEEPAGPTGGSGGARRDSSPGTGYGMTGRNGSYMSSGRGHQSDPISMVYADDSPFADSHDDARRASGSVPHQTGIGADYSSRLQRPDTDEEQLREQYRIMAMNQARDRVRERTGYDPSAAAGEATGGSGTGGGSVGSGSRSGPGGSGTGAAGVARADGAAGRAGDRPPGPKPREGRPPPPPQPVEPPLPPPRPFPTIYRVAKGGSSSSSNKRHVPDLCAGKLVGNTGGEGLNELLFRQRLRAAGGSEDELGLDDDEHVVRCLSCHSGLKVKKLASLVRCEVCDGVSPATGVRIHRQ